MNTLIGLGLLGLLMAYLMFVVWMLEFLMDSSNGDSWGFVLWVFCIVAPPTLFIGVLSDLSII